jgi:hypothetical protein
VVLLVAIAVPLLLPHRFGLMAVLVVGAATQAVLLRVGLVGGTKALNNAASRPPFAPITGSTPPAFGRVNTTTE